MRGPRTQYFINRELSWLEFNARVLGEVLESNNPLLERVKFFTIFSSNLDEFFEVRVAGLRQQVESEVSERSVDGATPKQTLRAINQKVRQLVDQQYRCWHTELVPALERSGFQFLDFAQLTPAEREWLKKYYRSEVRPVLTPLVIDSAHPFPQLLNKSLNLIVQWENENQPERRPCLAVVQVPRILHRLIALPREGAARRFFYLENLIGSYLGDLFTGMKIHGYWLFRLTRNGELYIDEEEVSNLLKAVESELHKRRRGEAVRLEVQRGCPAEVQAELMDNVHLEKEDLHEIDGPLNSRDLLQIYEDDQAPELLDPPFIPQMPSALLDSPDIFAAIRKQDVLLHHPYESFDVVVNFLNASAEDPDVLAIKQTLYRTGGDPRLVGALMKAANNGKQVTVVVELRARFDEANNIEWTRRLEEAGVHVVYGLVGLKIHAKICLVVRREDMGIRRYVHLSSGNYNPTTARVYTDLGLFTCQPEFGEDATNLFNLLTGICQYPGMQRFSVAPFTLRPRILELIQRETDHANKGLPAHIIAKMNSLVDPDTIEALYRASEAGVQIDLIVRGTCCLRPGLKDVSRNIRVRSIVDRFLEHSRVFYFSNACQPEFYIGSADWMPRNFHHRVEVLFPVKDGIIRERIIQEILHLSLNDNLKAWALHPDGSYRRLRPGRGQTPVRSQSEFLRLAREAPTLSRHSTAAKKKHPQVRVAASPHLTSRGKTG